MSGDSSRSVSVAADPVDFVITWVDGQDAAWRESRSAHLPDERKVLEGSWEERFRDWGTLRYWFRAVEEFCPWVRRVHFVTANPPPSWMVQDHPKLNIVWHHDFIPSEYLPTFNSQAIEVNLHRIPGLAENFVYFNDDTFPLRTLSPEHFFPGGKPVGIAVSNAFSYADNHSHALLNATGIINDHFDKRRVMRQHWKKWFSPSYGALTSKNVLLAPWPRFTGFYVHHLPQVLRRSTFDAVWDATPEALQLTAESKFRQFHDISPAVFSYWQLCTGDFSPVAPSSFGQYVSLGREPMSAAISAIRAQSAALLCVNDGPGIDFERDRRELLSALGSVLPAASSFEIGE